MIELKMVHKSKMLVQITLHMSVGQYLRYHNNEACNHFVYEPPLFFFWGTGVYYLLPTRPSLPESRTQAPTKTPNLGRNATRSRNVLVYDPFIAIGSP